MTPYNSLDFKNLSIQDFDYPLTDDRIAKYPLKERDHSKLLHYKEGVVEEAHFYDLPGLLPKDALIVVNDTRVIRARLVFHKPTGGRIEVFCLDPFDPELYELSLSAKHSCVWHCLVGNSKKWKEASLSIELPAGETFSAERIDAEKSLVRFSWSGEYTFGEMLDILGELPIPPYLNRDTEESDLTTYQTVYAVQEGSVAAPTAGLHFTDKVLGELQDKGIRIAKLTLHVGAGTFLPVKGKNMGEHTMHREVIHVTGMTLKELYDQKEAGRPIIAVGTTSTRTLESLYYMGANIIKKESKPYHVNQWDPYEGDFDGISTLDALRALQNTEVIGDTQLLIEPGFKYRLVDKLITNFHQPHSTLLLLIAAFVGEDWKKIYDYALGHDFRFLSYGDSSLLEPSK